MMNKLLRSLGWIFLLTFLIPTISWAQSAPPSNLADVALRTWLKQNWFDGYINALGYNGARQAIYSYVDSQNGTVYCVYTNFSQPAAVTTYLNPINAEHTVPQSWFSGNEPMKSDIHHLYPTHGSVNGARSNYPFAENDDSNTDTWYTIDGLGAYTTTTTLPTSNLDAYSELDTDSPHNSAQAFEPMESHKGNVARAVFYFYTMYPTEAGPIENIVADGDISLLYQWHLQDPVDANEIARNNKAEERQGNRNPYIDHPDLVATAWGFTTSGGSNSGGSGNGIASELFLSEYVEGSSNNKVIEVANFTGTSADLSSYSIKKQTNGAGAWSAGLSLSGTLTDGDVYVIASASASPSASANADLTSSAGELAFNGNDPIGLFKDGNLIDIIGNFNSTATFGSNVTLVRKSAVTSPNTSYASSEWDSHASDEFGYLGSHTIDTPPPPPPATTTVTLTLTFDNYPSETSWTLLDANNNTIASGGNYSLPAVTITEDFELVDGCYDFVINDAYNDGICCYYGNGSYSLVSGTNTIASGGAFGAGETTNFCVGGSSRYSKPSTQSLESPVDYLGVYPNPASHHATVKLHKHPKEDLTVQVISMDGAIVLEKMLSKDEGQQAVDLDVSQLLSGMYIIQVHGNAFHQLSKLVVE